MATEPHAHAPQSADAGGGASDQSEASETSLAADAQDQNPRRPPRHVVGWITLAVLVLVSVGALAIPGASWLGAYAPASPLRPLTYRVKPAGITLTATERASVMAIHVEEIRCRLPGGGLIEYLIPDGTIVKAGDLLLRLDSAAIELMVMQEEIAYERAKALKIQSEQTHATAELAIREYLEGTLVSTLKAAEAAIVVAEETLRGAQDTLEHTENLHRKEYVTQLELQNARFAVQKARLDLQTATTARDVLVNFTKPKTVATLESARDAAKAHLQAELQAFEIQLARLNRYRDQLKSCEYFAPRPGMVVHNNDEDDNDPWDGLDIQEGGRVREGQIMILLPDLTQMQARAWVHESRIGFVQAGSRARVTVQDREFFGTVTSVDNQPLPANFIAPSVREFYAYVRIDGTPEGLRPGMIGQVEFLSQRKDNILAVPAESLVGDEGNFACWVKTDSGYERRAVDVGVSNNRFVEVTKGLSDGDEILLDPQRVLAASALGDARFLSESVVNLAATTHQFEPAIVQTIRRKDLDITYAGDGLLNSQSDTSVTCLVPGEPTIAWVIDDGALVEKGDELLRLDGSVIQAEIELQEVLVARALGLRDQSRYTLESAKSAVDAYLDGEFKQLLKTAEVAIAVAEENVKTASETLISARSMARRGFITSLQLEAQVFAARRAQLDLDVAVTARDSLVNFTKVKMVGDLAAARDIAEAAMRAEEAAYELELAKLTLSREQLNFCVYTAPGPGMVVHINSFSRRVEPGVQVYYSRRLLRLPDLSKMKVELKVNEAVVDRIKVGMATKVKVFGQLYDGRVTTIGLRPAPEEGFSFVPSANRRYLVEIEIPQAVSGLKPGMTANVVINITRRPNVLAAPVSAIVERDGKFYCWVRRNGALVERPITIGLTDLKEIEVSDGLVEGDQVVINPEAAIMETHIETVAPESMASMQSRFGVATDVAATAHDDESDMNIPGG